MGFPRSEGYSETLDHSTFKAMAGDFSCTFGGRNRTQGELADASVILIFISSLEGFRFRDAPCIAAVPTRRIEQKPEGKGDSCKGGGCRAHPAAGCLAVLGKEVL